MPLSQQLKEQLGDIPPEHYIAYYIEQIQQNSEFNTVKERETLVVEESEKGQEEEEKGEDLSPAK